jgi:hypothetical protein
MNGDPKITDTQLKLYQLLVDQLQKHSTILWQFPTALLAANAFALDKFFMRPWLILVMAAIDGVFAYSYHRMATQLRAVIGATKAAEALLKESGYEIFIPKFRESKISGVSILCLMLWLIAAGLGMYSFIKLLGC